MIKDIGNFKLSVGCSGYPVWIHISYPGGEIGAIHFRELGDLKHCVNEAIRESILELTKTKQIADIEFLKSIQKGQ